MAKESVQAGMMSGPGTGAKKMSDEIVTGSVSGPATKDIKKTS